MEGIMASITIRNLDDTLKRSLRIRAAEHGRSMEEEAREILRQRGHINGEPRKAMGALDHRQDLCQADSPPLRRRRKAQSFFPHMSIIWLIFCWSSGSSLLNLRKKASFRTSSLGSALSSRR